MSQGCSPLRLCRRLFARPRQFNRVFGRRLQDARSGFRRKISQAGDCFCVQLLEQGNDQIDHAIEIGPVHHPIMGVGVSHRNNQIDGWHAAGRLLISAESSP